MKQVSIVGGGNVGTNTAFFLAENGTASVTLIDIKEGVTTGKALDLMEAGPLRSYDIGIRGSNDIADIQGSDVVVIAAGRVRKPGERRTDLYRDNAPTIREICASIKKHAPSAVVVNLVEPVDLLTRLAWKTLGCDRLSVLGVGGLLSATRIRYLVSNALKVSPRDVTALVVGPHRRDMVFLRNSIRVSGIPLSKLVDADLMENLIEQARRAGDTILDLAQRSTSYYAPSAAAARLVEVILRDAHAILPVSVSCEGEYGVEDLCVGVPAMVGAKGAERILNVQMSDDETRAFREATTELKKVALQLTRDEPAA